MPPQRRRPGAPPTRRPKVAGLRNRPTTPDATDAPADEPTTPEPEARLPAPEPPAARARPAEPADPPAATADSPAEPADPPAGTVAPADQPAESVDSSAEPADRLTTTAESARAARTEAPAGAAEQAADESPAETGAVAEKSSEGTPRGRRPAGKRRVGGTARPTDLAAAEKDTDTPAARPGAPARPARSRAQRQLSVALVLVVVAVVLGGLAVFFRGQAESLTSGDDNNALTDSAATSQVVGQLSDAVKKTFSYNYTDLESTEKAVKEVLAGTARCEYDLLFAELKKYAPEQKIILATTVREIGVVRLQGDRAEALIYIDQQSTRVDVNKTVYVGGQFAVQAHRQGDRWKITKFDMFGQSLLNGQPAPTC